MTKRVKTARKANERGSSIVPCLTFDKDGEDDVKLSVSTFKDSGVLSLMRHTPAMIQAMFGMHKLDLAAPRKAYRS